MKIEVPKVAKNALTLIEKKGYKAFLVGGTVRDLLLFLEGIERNLNINELDIDIATDALPNEIKEIFKGFKQFYSGIRHGTVGVFFQGKKIDITTFRVEGFYSDGRRPDTVEFVQDLKEDLARRDFTINAMATDANGNVFDPYNGYLDLKHKIIRAVGIPENRFQEDSLRIIRAIRFAAKLNFQIENKTLDAIKKSVHLLQKHKISPERIYVELEKTLKYSPLTGLSYFNITGLSKILFPETFSWCHTLVSKYGKLLNKFDVELSFAIIYLKGLREKLNLSPSFSERNIEKLKNFFLKRYPGLGKWRAVQIALHLLLMEDTFKLDDTTASLGEIRRWCFKPWHYLKTKQKGFYKIVLRQTKEAIIVLGKEDGRKYTTLDFEIDRIITRLDGYQKSINGDDLKELGIHGKAISDGLKLIDMISIITEGNIEPSEILTGWIENRQTTLKSLRNLISVNQPTFSEDEDFSLLELIKIEGKIRKQVGTYCEIKIDSLNQKRPWFINQIKQQMKRDSKFGIVLRFETGFD